MGAQGYNACLMLKKCLCSLAQSQTYVDLVIAEAFLHLVEQAAVGELTEGRQVVVGGWRHQFNLRQAQA